MGSNVPDVATLLAQAVLHASGAMAAYAADHRDDYGALDAEAENIFIAIEWAHAQARRGGRSYLWAMVANGVRMSSASRRASWGGLLCGG